MKDISMILYAWLRNMRNGRIHKRNVDLCLDGGYIIMAVPTSSLEVGLLQPHLDNLQAFINPRGRVWAGVDDAFCDAISHNVPTQITIDLAYIQASGTYHPIPGATGCFRGLQTPRGLVAKNKPTLPAFLT